jgi:ATP/maltotriose-dependent transcriptional regulator MalT
MRLHALGIIAEYHYHIATILGITESTVKKHVQEMCEKLGVETRGAATVRALEVLNSHSHVGTHQNR